MSLSAREFAAGMLEQGSVRGFKPKGDAAETPVRLTYVG
jgi:hypothetical protein